MEEQQPEQQPERGIRPIWLIGGGATLVTLTLCAIVSLVFAAGLVLFSNNRNDSNRESTQVVVARATQQGATSVAPTLTPLPSLPTRTPLAAPTPIPIPTQNTGARTTPDQAVRDYFNLVSQQQYDRSWNLLTEGFKQKFNCCAPGYDYAGYTGWWDSVDRVEFGTVNTLSQNGDRAVVYAELYFVMNNGQRSGIDSNPYIEVTFDPFMNAWRFVDKRAGA